MDDEKSQNIANELTGFEVDITHIRNDRKELPLVQKMAKAKEMRKLQQQMAVMCTQQHHREEKVEELQDEVERVIGLIQLVHQNLCNTVESIEKFMPKHVIFDMVEKLKKTKEEVYEEAERVVKIMEYFHSKINASKIMEE